MRSPIPSAVAKRWRRVPNDVGDDGSAPEMMLDMQGGRHTASPIQEGARMLRRPLLPDKDFLAGHGQFCRALDGSGWLWSLWKLQECLMRLLQAFGHCPWLWMALGACTRLWTALG